jgi:quercetin dioxygenase-like cupin family protein
MPAQAWNWKNIEPYVDHEAFTARRIITDRTTIKRGISAAASVAPDHEHPYDQWFHLLSGEATMTCGGAPFSLRKGSVIFIPAGETHNLVCHTECELLEIGLGTDGAA